MGKCSMCKKRDIVPEYRPFCSKRCADIDLSRWLSDGYVIPGGPAQEEDGVPNDFRENGDDKDN